MWLLEASTYKLKWFLEDDRSHGGYAILSHTWGDDEVSFQDIRNIDLSKRGYDALSHSWEGGQVTYRESQDVGVGPYLRESMKGFHKIELCCQQAIRDGFQFVWIDTCCIDKTSSAELSEAINSMFRWYMKADICYAYLSDVVFPSQGDDAYDSFKRSVWFQRGWTLQELIAAPRINFYALDWQSIGTKASLSAKLEDITSIPLYTDGDRLHMSRYSAARKLSWAARRKTTRPEDRAYSLLGIFNVHMPLLYGEGEKNAFIRLQAEILKSARDLSILLWHRVQTDATRGVVADSVSKFENCGNVFNCFTYKDDHRFPIELISAPFPQVRATLPVLDKKFALLNCKRDHRALGPMAIELIDEEVESGNQIQGRKDEIWPTDERVVDTRANPEPVNCLRLRSSIKMTRLLLSDRRHEYNSNVHDNACIVVTPDTWCLDNLSQADLKNASTHGFEYIDKLAEANAFADKTIGMVSHSEIESKVINIVADALLVSPNTLTRDTRLDDIGIDSLLAVEIRQQIETLFMQEISLDSLLDAANIRSVCEILQQHEASQQAPSFNDHDGRSHKKPKHGESTDQSIPEGEWIGQVIKNEHAAALGFRCKALSFMLIFRREGHEALRPFTVCRAVRSRDDLSNLDVSQLDEDGWAWLDSRHTGHRQLRWSLMLSREEGIDIYTSWEPRASGMDYWFFEMQHHTHGFGAPCMQRVPDVTGKYRLPATGDGL